MEKGILFCKTTAVADFVRFVGICIERSFAWIEFILTEGYVLKHRYVKSNVEWEAVEKMPHDWRLKTIMNDMR